MFSAHASALRALDERPTPLTTAALGADLATEMNHERDGLSARRWWLTVPRLFGPKSIAAYAVVGISAMLFWSAHAGASTAMTYTGDGPRDSPTAIVPQPLNLTIQQNRITAFQFPARLRCTDGTLMAVVLISDQLKTPPIALKGNSFSFTVGDAGTGEGLNARLSGTVTAGRIVIGHAHVEAHESGGVTPAGPLCSSSYSWIATYAPVVAKLLQSTLTDAAARGSFHEDETASSGNVVVDYSNDVAAREGQQTISIRGEGQARVIVFDDTAYIYSSQSAVLANFFGLRPSVAARVRGRWISVPSSSSDYATVAGDSTLPSTLGFLTPGNSLTETAKTEQDGQSVVGINGQKPGATTYVTLYVTRAAHPLPVAARYESVVDSPAGEVTATFHISRWGERVSIKPPTGALPIATLGG